MALDSNIQKCLDSEISASLTTLYWYNLWFALMWRVELGNIKENIQQIQEDVAQLIEQSWRWWNHSLDQIKRQVKMQLSEKELSDKAKKYESYKNWVIARWENSSAAL